MMPLVTIRNVQAFNPGYISVGGRAEGGMMVVLEANGKATPPQRLTIKAAINSASVSISRRKGQAQGDAH